MSFNNKTLWLHGFFLFILFLFLLFALKSLSLLLFDAIAIDFTNIFTVIIYTIITIGFSILFFCLGFCVWSLLLRFSFANESVFVVVILFDFHLCVYYNFFFFHFSFHPLNYHSMFVRLFCGQWYCTKIHLFWSQR